MKPITSFLFLFSSFFVSALNFDYSKENIQDQLINSIKQKIPNKQFVNKSGSFVTVGGDNACDYRIGTSKIQDAIDANEVEIRIAKNDTYNENLIIDDKSVILRGSYENCTDAANDITSNIVTNIVGVNAVNLPVLRVEGDTQRNNIVLDRISLIGGTGTGAFPGGGISTSLANAEINISNSYINDNLGEKGGGIAIIGGQVSINMDSSHVYNNTADVGGGLYCDNSSSVFFINGFSGLSVNKANGSSGTNAGRGGAAFLTNGCQFFMFSGTASESNDFSYGIANNTAVAEGGGIYAENGSIVQLIGNEVCVDDNCFGDNTNPINITNNRSNSDNNGNEGGGGIYITGTNTTLNILAGLVKDNKAGINGVGNGGAISVNSGATFSIDRSMKQCWSQVHCNYVVDNTAGEGGGSGGAILNNGATVNITNAVFENNRADFGTVLFGFNPNSLTTIKGSVIHHNGNSGADNFDDSLVFSVSLGAEIDIVFSTIADNNAQTAVFGIDSSAGGTSNLGSSIVHDSSTGPVYDSNPGAAFAACSLLHELDSVPLHGSTFVDDPEFVDRNNKNYHINPLTSPALDYCGKNQSGHPDMDFEARGWDDPTVTNIFGPYDIGADETYGNDIIFKNGFEM